MSQLIFLNTLINEGIEEIDINIESYKKNHPAGNIGLNLKKVKDILIKDIPTLYYKESYKLDEIILEMTRYSIGCCFFVKINIGGINWIIIRLIVRRIILNNNNNIILNKDINTNYQFIEDDNLYLYNLKSNKNFKKSNSYSYYK